MGRHFVARSPPPFSRLARLPACCRARARTAALSPSFALARAPRSHGSGHRGLRGVVPPRSADDGTEGPKKPLTVTRASRGRGAPRRVRTCCAPVPGRPAPNTAACVSLAPRGRGFARARIGRNRRLSERTLSPGPQRSAPVMGTVEAETPPSMRSTRRGRAAPGRGRLGGTARAGRAHTQTRASLPPAGLRRSAVGRTLTNMGPATSCTAGSEGRAAACAPDG